MILPIGSLPIGSEPIAAPPPAAIPVTWNAGFKSGNITLSNGNLTATGTASSNSNVRSNFFASTGKWYFECFMSTIVGNSWGIGWANALASLSTFIGADANGVMIFPSQSGIVILGNSTITTLIGDVVNQVVCVAFDIPNKLIWFRYGGGFWNNSISADPGSGTGGISVSGLNAGPYYPAFNINGNGSVGVANFGATSFRCPIPSGFSGLDTNAQAYDASSKFVAYAVLSPPQTAVASSKFVAYAVTYQIPINAEAISKLLGYTIISVPQTAISISKLNAYAILNTRIYRPIKNRKLEQQIYRR